MSTSRTTDNLVELRHRLQVHLQLIYPDADHSALTEALLERGGLSDGCHAPERHQNLWDEGDNLLITYGDSIVDGDATPLHTLHQFLDEHLKGTISGVHILPFFPYSSDDGFAVMDYSSVNPSLGDWDDITAIANDYRLMSDLVLNHASSRSLWFDNFKQRRNPGKDYFFEGDPAADLSAVVRPRSSPLLTEVETADGVRHVWCTFSADQVDLNFANPAVLLEFAGIVRDYLERGVRLFRMDAVAFLWKLPGTPSVHLPQTHEIIKLLRTLIEHHTADAVVITETNVPNRENLTYFGNANEAHLIYNFSLPPLLVYTLVSGDCRHLKTWMMSMPPAQAGTAYLNFIASHDGIGLRPLDGLLEQADIDGLVQCMRDFGARVTTRRAREGYDKPYEINVSLFDALQGTRAGGRDALQVDRFVCAHAIMLALEGIPALYIHSLFGTENDEQRVEHTGNNRSINRHIWKQSELYAALADDRCHHKTVFQKMTGLLNVRSAQSAFHPNATQFTLHLGTEVFAFWRQSVDRSQSIFCLYNVTDSTQVLNLSDINLIGTECWRDLVSGRDYNDLTARMQLAPYQAVWLTNRFEERGV
ncbi:MAG: sugar phosphorylase [Marinobacter sp.]|uniref:sugar phosphorylase n=1 Tax=Marinobacter sp. TaxID=50741 RepID=UPI00329A3FFE